MQIRGRRQYMFEVGETRMSDFHYESGESIFSIIEPESGHTSTDAQYK